MVEEPYINCLVESEQYFNCLVELPLYNSMKIFSNEARAYVYLGVYILI